ncbi:hypothetical protein [Sphingomonas turrisvirgatae]|uniref:hypothetical protein n=1 Tax=Sphingomonas turrisvirgatae TaxID=1888892 RepID=UPI00130103A7|nr:hypothetical protein [Sphingomonas turrisvirgatae]
MAGLLPVPPAGLWLMAASMLVRITRLARAFSLISPACAIVLIKWVDGFTAADFTHGVATEGSGVAPEYGEDRHNGEQQAAGGNRRCRDNWSVRMRAD